MLSTIYLYLSNSVPFAYQVTPLYHIHQSQILNYKFLPLVQTFIQRLQRDLRQSNYKIQASVSNVSFLLAYNATIRITIRSQVFSPKYFFFLPQKILNASRDEREFRWKSWTVRFKDDSEAYRIVRSFIKSSQVSLDFWTEI